MKIILSAFSGNMLSKPMDIPEDSGFRWRMVMTQPIQVYQNNLRPTPLMNNPLNTMLTFEWNGKSIICDNTICREYVLVEIN